MVAITWFSNFVNVSICMAHTNETIVLAIRLYSSFAGIRPTAISTSASTNRTVLRIMLIFRFPIQRSIAIDNITPHTKAITGIR